MASLPRMVVASTIKRLRRNIMNINKTKYTAIALALAVALLAGSAIMAVGLVENTEKPADVLNDTSAGLVFDEAATEGGWEHLSQEEVEAKLNEQLEEGMINISMNTSPYFEDGTSKGNLMIVNETINRYPQKVQIIRNDTEEIIYTSGAIAVGSKIEAAALDVDLDAGTYECTALFHNLDNSGNIIGSAGAIITITIKN